MKKIFIALCIGYSLLLHTLLIINFSNSPNQRAIIMMGLALFVIWVIFCGFIQLMILRIKWGKAVRGRPHALLTFVSISVLLACIEEAIAVSITNAAPLFGVPIGSAYITASTNYIDVITRHSVIVFLPMLIMLGVIVRRYALTQFQTFILWGTIGICVEFSFAGPQVLLNAPTCLCIYGLMVYLPAHFMQLERRKRVTALHYAVFIVLILLSSFATTWVPRVLNEPRIHFSPIIL
jgi:hypothetical protein